MRFRQRDVLKITAIACAMLIAIICNDIASADEALNLVPPKTEQTKSETRVIGGKEINFTYFISSLDIENLKNFYRPKLQALGWKEKDLINDLAQLPNVKIDSTANKLLQQNLMFEKGQQVLIINFIEGDRFPDKKTRFTFSLTQATIAKPGQETDFIPRLLAEPKKEIAPVYEGASLVDLRENKNSYKATYIIKDDIDTVAEFYKTNMLNYGWFFREETPIQEQLTPGKFDIANCPSCAKTAGGISTPKATLVGELVFSNEKGDSCRIGLSRLVGDEKQKGAHDVSIIMVNYEEKK